MPTITHGHLPSLYPQTNPERLLMKELKFWFYCFYYKKLTGLKKIFFPEMNTSHRNSENLLLYVNRAVPHMTVRNGQTINAVWEGWSGAAELHTSRQPFQWAHLSNVSDPQTKGWGKLRRTRHTFQPGYKSPGLFKPSNENASLIETVDVKPPIYCKSREKKPKKTH